MTLPAFTQNLPQGYTSYTQYHDAVATRLAEENPDVTAIYNEARAALPDDIDQKKAALRECLRPKISNLDSYLDSSEDWVPAWLLATVPHKFFKNATTLFLLLYPGLNPNKGKWMGSNPGCTALSLALEYDNQTGLKLLLQHPELDYSLFTKDFGTASYQKTVFPSDFFCKQEITTLEKIFLKNDLPSEVITYSAKNVSGHTATYQLFRDYLEDPIKIKTQLTGKYTDLSVPCFMQIVFLCDDYLILKADQTEETENMSKARRFFSMATKLPMELQMLLCNRVFGKSKNHILWKDLERTIKLTFRSSECKFCI